MSEFNVFPAVDSLLQFPQALRQAIALYPEIQALLTKAKVGLGNVDNTSDVNKPVSTATTAQLNLKAPLASPKFTGTPTGITKSHVGLANVDNTTDAAKPVSTAQRTAIDLTAKGQVYLDKLDSVGGNLTDAVVNNIPSFNFVAGRNYEIIWDMSFYQSVMANQFIWGIYSSPVGDSATALTNLSPLVERARGALGANGFTQNNGAVIASFKSVTTGNLQIKFRVRRTVGAGTLTPVCTPTEYGIFKIVDLGASS